MTTRGFIGSTAIIAENYGAVKRRSDEHIQRARRHIYDAIAELRQSGRANEVIRELRRLCVIEDTLWQMTTEGR